MLALGALTARGADSELRIPPLPIHLDLEGRPLAVVISGTVSMAAGRGEQVLRAGLNADLSDLQRNLTDVLKAGLDQNERCGERISVQNATLVPQAPSGTLTVNLHVERWGCVKALGREIVKKLVGGDGTVVVRLTPQVEDDDTLRMQAEVVSVDATGQLGDLLHSGQYGDALREKVRKTIVSALRKITDLKASLPPALRDMVDIRGAEFRDGGSGKLLLALTSEARLPEEQARALLDRLKSEVK